MSGDYSRQRFDPLKDFGGVLMQQGRVQLDADWNELVDIIERRLRAETTDTIGRATVPTQTPDAFLIDISTTPPTIGPGRMYVDGLLAENHGKGRLDPAHPNERLLEFDPVLAELHGPEPVPYTEQPYFPNAATVAPFPEAGGPHLVYLDVWQREVTYLEDEHLLEVAVGVDTTTRKQTVWQVRVLEDVGSGLTCDSRDSDFKGWSDKLRPTAGRLTTAAVGVAEDDDPCLTPPGGGFKGLENRLYRVEVHDPGPPGTATFAWSHDNASVATAVVAIPDLDKLIVARVGRDAVLRFSEGQWIEIIDDHREFAGLPGVMALIEHVDDDTRTITLTAALAGGTFFTDAQGATDPVRHTRIRRWDQKGKVSDTANVELVDLNGPNSKGVIPVPPDGTSIVLEDGVQITFSTTPQGGDYHTGDYWTFAARTVDASVEELTAAPPRGVHHHYARLAIVTLPAEMQSCRTFWPPEFGEAGCDCTVCVSPEGGGRALQEAIDQVKEVGGTICLAPGLYNLTDPIRISAAKSLRIRGHGWTTRLVYLGSGPAFRVENSIDVTLEELAVVTSGAGAEAGTAVDARNCIGLTVERCALLQAGATKTALPAIGLAGIMAGTFVHENLIAAATGIGNGPAVQLVVAVLVPPNRGLLTLGLIVENNFIIARERGIDLARTSIHLGQTRIATNYVTASAEAGIAALGKTTGGSGIEIAGNYVQVPGSAIVVASDNAQIGANFVSAPVRSEGAGIVLDSGIGHCAVVNNRITGTGGDGIAVRTAIRSALIKQNVLDGTGGGIVMTSDASADALDIEGNQLLGIARGANDQERELLAIRVLRTAHVAITNNAVIGHASDAVQNPRRVGIQVVGPSTSARIAGNELADIGPAGEFVKEGIGIEYTGPFERLAVVDNRIRRASQPSAAGAASSWQAIRITGPRLGIQLPFSGNLGFFMREDAVFSISGFKVTRLSIGGGNVTVRGNQLDSYGAAETAVVATRGACDFSANQCSLAPGRTAVARVTAGSIIAGSNYVDGPTDTALDLHVLGAGGSFTVLGNITRGAILVNNGVLGGPWSALNAPAP